MPRDRLFLAIMKSMTAIRSRMIVVRMAMMTPTKFCSGSWSIGFGDITADDREDIVCIVRWNHKDSYYLLYYHAHAEPYRI